MSVKNGAMPEFGKYLPCEPIKITPLCFLSSCRGDALKCILTAAVLYLNPSAGCGTTLIACEQTERMCYAMEISPVYCDLIVKRWETFTGATAVKLEV